MTQPPRTTTPRPARQSDRAAALIGHFRRRYGASPLHLLALAASFTVTAAAVIRWFDSGSDVIKILVWFVGAIVAHDLILLPLYSLVDRLVVGRGALRDTAATPRVGASTPGVVTAPSIPAPPGAAAASVAAPTPRDAAAAPRRSPRWVYVRIPALLSGLLFLVFFPAILGQGSDTFHAASGLNQDPYLARWLVTSGVLFALSGLALAIRTARERPATPPPAAPRAPSVPPPH